MTISPNVVGIDVSKHTLDLFETATRRSERIVNDPTAAAALAARLAAAEANAVFEATGDYDLVLRRKLEAAGVPYARLNPSQVRDFAKAAGYLAKTDRIDARMLASFALALKPAPTARSDADRERLVRLSRRRDQLVAVRKQERTRGSECPEPEVAASIARHLAMLDAEIAQLERVIAAHIAACPELRAASELLRSVPGVGPVTATVLLGACPELGRRPGKSIAALAGLAPFNADSGRFRGKRSIRGGRKRVRDAAYMAAVVAATRTRSRFAAFFQSLIAAGKPAKLALVAVARKLLVTLNAILRDGIPFADAPVAPGPLASAPQMAP